MVKIWRYSLKSNIVRVCLQRWRYNAKMLPRFCFDTTKYSWKSTWKRCASVGTATDVRCSVRSCLLLLTSHTSSITDTELLVQTARRWSSDQTMGCSPLTGDKRGTTGSRFVWAFSEVKWAHSSASGSSFMTTLPGNDWTMSGAPEAAMFFLKRKWRTERDRKWLRIFWIK